MDVDKANEAEDPKQRKIKEAIDTVTDAADKLLKRDTPTSTTQRELLIREYRNETGEQWVDPRSKRRRRREEEREDGGGEWEPFPNVGVPMDRWAGRHHTRSHLRGR